MRIPFTQVDAFADRPFAGNPAAVMPHSPRESRSSRSNTRDSSTSTTSAPTVWPDVSTTGVPTRRIGSPSAACDPVSWLITIGDR